MHEAYSSFSTGFAKNSHESAFPNLWIGLVGAWCPSLGRTGDRLYDISGHGHKASLTGFAFSGSTSNYVPSPNGWALDYDGTDDLADAGTIYELDSFNTIKCSISFWMKADNTVGDAAIITYDNNNSLSPGTDWYLMFKTNFTIGGFGDNAEYNTGYPSSSMRDGKWHHVVVVARQNALELWVDNEKKLTTAITHSSKTFNSSFSLQFAPVENVARYAGSIGDVFLYTRDLQPYEIGQLYTGQTPLVLAPAPTSSAGFQILDLFTINVTGENYISKIISYNPLIYATYTNPAKIVKVDISNPSSPSYDVHTISTAINVQDVTINETTGFIYLACASGLVVKVDINDLDDQTIINVSDTDDLQIIDVNYNVGIVYAGTDNILGELYMLDERETLALEGDIRVLSPGAFIMDGSISVIQATILDSDIRVLGETQFIMDGDVRTLNQGVNIALPVSIFDQISPIRQTDFHIFVDDIELSDTDVDLSSIKIVKSIDERTQATVVLNRRHDRFNYDLNGNFRQISNQNNLKIYIKNKLEFDGGISNVDCQFTSEEQVILTGTGTEDSYNYNLKTLRLPSENERLGLYDVLIQNPQIQNYIVEDDETNPAKYKGIFVPLGHKVEQVVSRYSVFDNNHTDAEKIQKGTFIAKQNWQYFWSPSVKHIASVARVTTTSQTTTFRDSLGNAITIQNDKLRDFKLSQIQSEFTGSNFIEQGDTSLIYFDYIGTSLSPISGDLWVLQTAKHRRQRIYADKVSRLGVGKIFETQISDLNIGNSTALFNSLSSNGYINGSGTVLNKFKNSVFSAENLNIPYSLSIREALYSLLDGSFGVYLGVAPYKTVSSENGVLITKAKWVDLENGLYNIKEESYDYQKYVEQVATLEYEKIKNINGVILPDTSCSLSLTVDGYQYYDIKLLNRINIENTLEDNVFKNNNGFPLSVKSITINSDTLQTTLTADNIKSSVELEEIDGQYPNIDNYRSKETRKLIALKTDMNSKIKVE